MSSGKRPWPFSEEFQPQRYHVPGFLDTGDFAAEGSASSWHDMGPEDGIETARPPFNLQDTHIETQSFSTTEIVCFGSIIDVACQLRRSPVDASAFATQHPNDVLSWSIQPSGDYFSIGGWDFESHGAFAMINKRTCHQLRQVNGNRQLQFLAVASKENWASALDSWPKGLSDAILTIDVNAYGERSHASDVGSALSEMDVFLQRPLCGIEVPYYNPHYFPLQHDSEADMLHLNAPTGVQEASGKHSRTLQHPDQTADQTDDRAEIDSILNSLSHHNVLHEQLANSSVIKANLLPHQKVAIDFVNQRESGVSSGELSLWRQNDDREDRPWEHVITGFRSPEPQEAQGGIIADDMGLGKSLVILATIAGSLDRAIQHARIVDAEQDTDLRSTSKKHQPCGATLIIAPSSLLIDNWIDQIRCHTFPGFLPFHKYHGQRRREEIGQMLKCHIVFTTYATIAAEMGKTGGVLNSINWFRVVLDEAHEVRNMETKRFEAVSSIRAKHRWCLTGTPIQNTLEDLSALITFLQVPLLGHKLTFRKFVMGHHTLHQNDRFAPLRTLLGAVCLRRTRQLLSLPDPIQYMREVAFSATERLKYNEILERSRHGVDAVVSADQGRNVNSVMLRLVLTLRLFCTVGTSRLSESDSGEIPEDPDEALSHLHQRDQTDCISCSSPIYAISSARDTSSGFLIRACQHLVCHACMPQWRTQKCPKCVPSGGKRGKGECRDGSKARAHENQHESHVPPTEYPSKLRAFLADLETDMAGFSKPKCIVFSAWRKTLDLLSPELNRRGFQHGYIHGRLSLRDRLKVLHNFRSPTGANVLLMTLGTGAVGLNLAIATRVYLLEPQWNPFIELQAIGRALRLGQTDAVKIVRYIVKASVEDVSLNPPPQLSRQVTGSDSRAASCAGKPQSFSWLEEGLRRTDTRCLTRGVKLYLTYFSVKQIDRRHSRMVCSTMNAFRVARPGFVA